jgi:hypothetical protein
MNGREAEQIASLTTQVKSLVDQRVEDIARRTRQRDEDIARQTEEHQENQRAFAELRKAITDHPMTCPLRVEVNAIKKDEGANTTFRVQSRALLAAAVFVVGLSVDTILRLTAGS